uniref:Uncharacterized protein n=1 Tax=Rhodosorus marinus TaxID=101924 RepID=A0A7S2ZFJ0_9RHOD|mmetsp:Transcript_17413/g.70602  ORF Transcript_17413/g.70602 Transcript_17413/m.70602 type:complete len:114 (+) Transcript_17413:1687-2028(+)
MGVSQDSTAWAVPGTCFPRGSMVVGEKTTPHPQQAGQDVHKGLAALPSFNIPSCQTNVSERRTAPVSSGDRCRLYESTKAETVLNSGNMVIDNFPPKHVFITAAEACPDDIEL